MFCYNGKQEFVREEYIKKEDGDMRHNRKAAAVSALAIMAALGLSIPAYAADKKISG